TVSSKVQTVKTLIKDTGFIVANVVVSGTTKVITIDETGATIPTHSHIEYSFDGTTWVRKGAFITNALAHPIPDRTSITAKLVVDTPTTYYIDPAHDGEGSVNVDTTGKKLFKYVDVSSLITKFTYIANPGPSGISITGSVGPANGAAIIIPLSLRHAALETLKLKLQISTVAGTWVDAGQEGSQNIGGSTVQNSVIVTLHTPTSSSADSLLKFRLVPSKAAAGATDTNTGTYQQHIDGNLVKPSDWASTPVSYEVDTRKIPKIILAHTAGLALIAFSGQVRDLAIDDKMGSTSFGKVIQTANNGVAYPTVVPVYNFDDGAHANLWLEKAAFIKFLKDGLPISGEALTNTAPNWNAINMANFKVKWISNNIGALVSPSEKGEVTPKDSATIAKWIDTQSILDSLQAIAITGDTWHMKAQVALKAIITRLNALTGGVHKFDILVSTNSSFTSGSQTITLDQTTPVLTGLHMDDALNLYFKIKAVASVKFKASTIGAPTTFNPQVKWVNPATSNAFDKFVQVVKTALTGVVLSGQTNLITNQEPEALLKSTDGILSSTGHITGVEVVYKIDKVTAGVNNAEMPFDVFKAYLEGRITISGSNIIFGGKTIPNTYGFTSGNVKAPHAGIWKASDIKVGYRAKPGFVIDAAQKVATVLPTTTALARYIDLKDQVALLTQIKVDASATGHYVDTKNLKWTLPDGLKLSGAQMIAAHFNAEIQFIMTTGTATASSTGWTKDLSSIAATDDVAAKRHLSIRFVLKGV
ncbi:MAG: hypothetical protein KAG91_02115, partial [Mycoplasmataceae bacterium]|nr:hypothetical protein [Mycoplasmataceae bacterium]